MRINLPSSANPYLHAYGTNTTVSDIRKEVNSCIKNERYNPFRGFLYSAGFIKAFDEAIKKELTEKGYTYDTKKENVPFANTSFYNATNIGFKYNLPILHI